MIILHNGAPITDVTPGGAPVYVQGFEMVPAERQNAVHGLPGPMLQIQADGVDVGDANPQIINFQYDPANYSVTRGAGEKSNVITVRKLTVPPPPLDPTVLLLHGDGANGSTTFTDHSGYARTVTPINGVEVRTAQSRYGGSSIFFNKAAGSRMEVSDVRLLSLFDYDSLIEFWCYNLENFSQWMASSYSVGSINGWGIYRIVDGANPNGALAFGEASVPRIKSNDGSFPINTWHHVAVTTMNRTVTLWLNGAVVGAVTATPVSAIKESNRIYFGAQANAESFGNWYNGYLQEIRILQGAPGFTATFAPPTSAYADLASKTPFVDRADVGFLQVALHGNGVSGGTVFVNQGAIVRPCTNAGAEFSAAQSKFNGSSILFNGAAGLRTTCGFNPNTDQWAARAWVYATGDPDNFTLFSGNEGGLTDTFYVLRSGGTWIVGNGSSNAITTAASLTANAWHYVEATHTAGVFYLFVDGAIVASPTVSIGNSSATAFWLGARNATPLFLSGHMAEAELIVGTTPRTTAYSVPTTDFIPHSAWPPSP